MDKLYIFGHKKPDTDSVSSSIALSYLKNSIGYNSEPRILSPLNEETRFVLNYFGVKEPKFLNDIKLQLKDVNYHKGCFLNENTSIYNVYQFMIDNNITGVPVVDKDNKFKGLVTIKTIFKELISSDQTYLNTSYKNILDVLDGELILKYDDEIEGHVLAATYKSTTFLDTEKLDNSSILIVGDRDSVVEYAIRSNIKLLIIVGNNSINSYLLDLAKENKVNIIRTKLDSFHTAKKINLSNYIYNLITNNQIETFNENDYYDEFIIKSSKLGHNNYPIIDKNNTCLGLIRVTEINKKNKKKCILVDHNDSEISVLGLDEAEILEIVDHHKIGDLTTNQPINFRNMTVGSTCTIVFSMFNESHISIPNDIAGLLLSGVLSDTLALTSPTTTNYDIYVVNELSKMLNIDYMEYAHKMFKAGTSLKGKTENEIVNTDIKLFSLNEYEFIVSQIFTLNYEEILNNKEKYIDIINNIKVDRNVNMVILCVTDIINKGTYILYSNNCEETLELAFNVKNIYQGYYLPGVVSRKKQIVPNIMDIIK